MPFRCWHQSSERVYRNQESNSQILGDAMSRLNSLVLLLITCCFLGCDQAKEPAANAPIVPQLDIFYTAPVPGSSEAELRGLANAMLRNQGYSELIEPTRFIEHNSVRIIEGWTKKNDAR